MSIVTHDKVYLDAVPASSLEEVEHDVICVDEIQLLIEDVKW